VLVRLLIEDRNQLLLQTEESAITPIQPSTAEKRLGVRIRSVEGDKSLAVFLAVAERIAGVSARLMALEAT